MASSGGTVTTFADQIGTRTLTAVGSPALNTDGINNLPFCVLDGTDDTLSMGTALALTGDFTALMAIGHSDETQDQAFVGRNTFSAPYIRLHSTTQLTIRSDTSLVQTLTIPANRLVTRGFDVWMFKRTGSTLEVFLNFESLGTVTVTDTFTIDRIGKNQNAQLIKGGFGGAVFWQRATTPAEDLILKADWVAKWKSTVYYDADNGNDANAGWNALVPLKSLADARARSWRPNPYNVSGILAGIFRHDPLFISTSSSLVLAPLDSIIFKKAPLVRACIMGSTQVSLAGAVVNTGTEYKAAYTGAAPFSAYFVNGSNLADIFDNSKITRLIKGTKGALAVGEFDCDLTFFYLNTGGNPTGGMAEIPAASGVDADDSGIRISKDGFTTDGIDARFCVGDGFRPSGTNVTHKNFDSGWNNGDAFGPTSVTTGLGVFAIDGYGHHCGDMLNTSASPGDGFSCHGSIVTYIRCLSEANDKAGFDNVFGSVVVAIDCESRYDYQGYLNPDTTAGGNTDPIRETYTNFKITRRAGNQLKMFHVADPLASTLVVNGLTLIDEEANAGTYGIYSESGSHTALTYSGLVTTGIANDHKVSWNGAGTLVAA